MKNLDDMNENELKDYFLWLCGHNSHPQVPQICEDLFLELLTLREAIEELENLS